MPVYTVQSAMSKKDWRKFLHIATFRRNPKVLLIIDAMALISAFLLSWDAVNGFSIVRMMVLFAVFFFAAAGVVAYMVEKANLQRMGKNKSFELPNTFNFYEDKLGIKAAGSKQQSKVPYDNFHSCVESKQFFIFYLTYEEGIAIRKADVEDTDGLRAFLRERFGDRYGKL